MNKITSLKIKVSNTEFSIVVPTLCPYCGFSVLPTYRQGVTASYGGKWLVLSVFDVQCCNKNFFTTHVTTNTYATNAYHTDFLCSYPNMIAKNLPDAVTELSPRFVSLYNQSYTAECNGHIELAGSGYRNAIEVLIKDYAIKTQGKTVNEVGKKPLAKSIEEYLPTISLKNCADMIRFLGNDYTHYVSKYEGIEFEQLKRYLEFFVYAIDADMSMAEPIIETNRQSD